MKWRNLVSLNACGVFEVFKFRLMGDHTKTIKDKLLFLFNKIKQSCMDYRVAMVSVVITTLYAAFCCTLGNLFDAESVIWKFVWYEEDILRFFLLFVMATVFTENILPYEKKEHRIKTIRILCFVLAAVISAAFIAAQNVDKICKHIWSTVNQAENITMEWIGVLLVLLISELLLLDDTETLVELSLNFDIDYKDGIKEGEEYFEWGTIYISGMLLRL